MSERFPLNIPHSGPNDDVYSNCIRAYILEIKTLKEQLKQNINENSKLKKAISALEKQNSVLHSKVNSSEVSKQRLLTQLSELRSKYETAVQEVELLKSEKDRLIEKANSERSKTMELQRTLDINQDITQEKNDKIISTSKQNNQLKKENDKLLIENKELKNLISENAKIESEHSSKIQDLVMTNRKLDDRVKKYQEQKSSLQKVIEQSQVAIKDAKQNTELLQNQNDKLKESLSNKISEYQNLQNNFSELKVLFEKIKNAETDKEKLLLQIAEYENNLSKCNQDNQFLNDKLAESDNVILEQQKLIEKLASKLEAKSNKLLKHKKMVERAEILLEAAEAENKALKGQIEDHQIRFAETLSDTQRRHKMELSDVASRALAAEAKKADVERLLMESGRQFRVLESSLSRISDLERENAALYSGLRRRVEAERLSNDDFLTRALMTIERSESDFGRGRYY